MDFVGMLRALMDERGLGVRALASRVPCDKALISRLANARARPSQQMARRLDEVLGADGRLASAAAAMAAARTRGGVEDDEDPVRRRQFAGLAGASLFSAILAGPAAAAESFAAARRLRSLTPAQGEELLSHLQDQWHALVKTDNLLGPRHALTAVVSHLEVIDVILRSVRQPARSRALSLGARYAESAAWLHEDSGDLDGSRYWAGRCMEWAVEADDTLMVAWSLYRRSCQATAGDDPAQVIGLASAARRNAAPGPMLAAILQQEAQGHALDAATAACQHALSLARENAASGDPGDASGGHGSFCTRAYLDMQAGRCWLMLGQPAKALVPLSAAVDTLPAVYRRDRGVALSGLAAAFAASGEAEQGAKAALDALGVARSTGSARILAMTRSAAAALPRSSQVPAVAELREALAAVPAV